jgi:hypothetical protein
LRSLLLLLLLLALEVYILLLLLLLSRLTPSCLPPPLLLLLSAQYDVVTDRQQLCHRDWQAIQLGVQVKGVTEPVCVGWERGGAEGEGGRFEGGMW